MPRFLVALLLLVCTVGATAAPRTLLVLGDSLSAAYNMPVEAGWVHLLDDTLAERAPGEWQVVNASISGETTSGGLARLPAALTDHRPDLVILALGANDGLRGLPLATVRTNLARMIALAREAGANVALAGIELPVNYGEAYRSRLRRLYATLAQDEGVPLLPFLIEPIAADMANFQDDAVHPNVAAQPAIRDHVLGWLDREGLLGR
jgi:acyl-CoA thioesterase I